MLIHHIHLWYEYITDFWVEMMNEDKKRVHHLDLSVKNHTSGYEVSYHWKMIVYTCENDSSDMIEKYHGGPILITQIHGLKILVQFI